ncbi:MAG: phosphoenolpyruvate synthase [Candidatus Komeilibacteria bacterium CG11_big_fil_rev_8_21_14_0_20_36_20]|uniref:Phosphoenolpyruvate synthase n=1 Tax=Candidatus Komeilibacteria bacterium CG11_big_fil_rev_8_21_14_0_20_36_20 TaxID=1974477 RepID=A0A2H0NDC4_9BACT|nr:MAG: phosphoenolpyruvate synthase [Candidatus Komeilibacteria bacterium CG11_big_fil_rev_8_21_14_0_20_36_20]PIR81871.1 MAG: phosphoenolpyruvate synthase [Candidatus Komeilibacteria bacterium CG10_big_fil_rev_8_21_14_0_10_36_65]PJC55079.1 MAG: phosphoenolpyruvate synthase [Candidatus Komeilibacteria bacterium CG_4_9_14_0_2_um_filter_36_13]
MKKKFILWFKEIGIKDVPKVGGKNASLGEMYSKLTKKGVAIPNGFAVTAGGYDYFITSQGVKNKIKQILKDLNTHDIHNLQARAKAVREAILEADFPKDLEEQIFASYQILSKQYKSKNVDVAVRSSATAEDLPDASFAGQQDTYLNVEGEKELLDACRRCMASLFTDRAISYRADKGFDHFKVKLSITVQKMVRSDLAVSGVMFSIDTESGFRNAVLINAIYGLGEYIVQGMVNPDEYYVFKPTLLKNYQPIISKSLGLKKKKLVYDSKAKSNTKNLLVSKEDQNKFALSDKEVLQLAKWAAQIEEHYQKPMDLEWAKDGRTGKLFIVQARPETVRSQDDPNTLVEYSVQEKGHVLAVGASVGNKIGQGVAHIIKDAKHIDQFKAGEVLVTEMTDPDWEPIMKIASAIVTNSGGRTCHAAIISRELGIPCVVGTKNATEKIKNNQEITVSCAEGEKGFIYNGLVKFNIKKTNLKNFKKPKTKIMMNIGNPEMAMAQSFIPNEGVGLAREEFIISNYIRIHPLALLNFNKLKDQTAKKQIINLTSAYKDKKQFFIDKLAEGIARIAASFYPKDVIVRLSDFKSNEYANLIGGRQFEPVESNPMIGWRGASRYYDPKYLPAFKLECQALVKVREKMGLKNLKIMVPFCRTIEEGQKVLKILADNGLKRGKDGLEVYVMCEIPSNVLLAGEFAKIFDGFSIGSNDLTQLTLGVDRDSELVSHVYNERNQAVKNLVSQVIAVAKKYKRKIGICGQAPSDFPDFAQFLVQEGIDSISLNPDTVIKTSMAISQTEKKLKKKFKK